MPVKYTLEELLEVPKYNKRLHYLRYKETWKLVNREKVRKRLVKYEDKLVRLLQARTLHQCDDKYIKLCLKHFKGFITSEHRVIKPRIK